MNYAKIVNYDVANGPGIRTTLFVSGCNHKCKGCHNQDTWDENYGEEFTAYTMATLLNSIKRDHIKGLTLSGGDPLYPNNRLVVLSIVRTIKELYPNKDIWMWTGYLYEDICDLEIMKFVDVLVDGPFILRLRDLTLPYSGSPNQRVIDVKKTKAFGEIVLYNN